MSAEGFGDHVTTDGSLLQGRWCWCGCSWITTRRWEPMHGIYRTLDAELEVQRIIKRTGLTVFLVSLQESSRSYFGPC